MRKHIVARCAAVVLSSLTVLATPVNIKLARGASSVDNASQRTSGDTHNDFSLIANTTHLDHTSNHGRPFETNPSHNILSKRFVPLVPGSCRTDLEQIINGALAEAESMLSYAAEKMRVLRAVVTERPLRTIISMTAEEKRLLKLYEVFYGTLYYIGNTKSHGFANQVAFERLESFILTASTLATKLADRQEYNIEIRCDDFWIWDDFYPSGQTRLDMRYYSPSYGYLMETAKLVRCNEKPGMRAFVFTPGSQYAREALVLCPGHIPAWKQKYDAGDTLGTKHDSSALAFTPQQRKEIQDLWDYLPGTIIHELSHSSALLGSRSLIDAKLRDGTKAYAWTAIRNLARESRAKATQNADTFSLFVTALFMNMNDWSTGVAMPLGFVGLQHTKRDLNSDNDSAELPAETFSRRDDYYNGPYVKPYALSGSGIRPSPGGSSNTGGYADTYPGTYGGRGSRKRSFVKPSGQARNNDPYARKSSSGSSKLRPSVDVRPNTLSKAPAIGSRRSYRVAAPKLKGEDPRVLIREARDYSMRYYKHYLEWVAKQKAKASPNARGGPSSQAATGAPQRSSSGSAGSSRSSSNGRPSVVDLPVRPADPNSRSAGSRPPIAGGRITRPPRGPSI